MENTYKIIIVLVVAITLNYILKAIIKKLLNLKIGKLDVNKRRQKALTRLFQNIIKFILFIIVMILILSFFGISPDKVLASLGLITVVIGLALQDILKDFISGIFILLEGNYTIGDKVEIGSFKGEITEIGLKTTKIKADSGQIKILSNRNISEVTNYSIDNLILTLDVKFKFERQTMEIERELDILVKKMKTDYNKTIHIKGIESIDNDYIVYRITTEIDAIKKSDLKRDILREMKENFNHTKTKLEYSVTEV